MIRPQDHVQTLIDTARKATCAKDLRAAALIVGPQSRFRKLEGNLLAVASNGPPAGFSCTRDAACAATCGQSAVHAEMRALLAVAPSARQGAEMIHARVDAGGVLQTSREPRCPACTKHMLDAGVAALWLFHADGWKRWPMAEAHAMSAIARGIKLSLPGLEGLKKVRGVDDMIYASGPHMVCASGHTSGSQDLVWKDSKCWACGRPLSADEQGTPDVCPHEDCGAEQSKGSRPCLTGS